MFVVIKTYLTCQSDYLKEGRIMNLFGER